MNAINYEVKRTLDMQVKDNQCIGKILLSFDYDGRRNNNLYAFYLY